jgi:glycerophosphoryl diester phosphodiesterase
MNFSWLTPRDRPAVVAHRGSSGRAPENTIAAFRLACEEGADAIELDVHLSKDGHAVVIHDGTLDRTTSGSGPVRNYMLKQLKKFNAAPGWEHEYYSETVPTLKEVLEEFGPDLGINIEIKLERKSASRKELLKNCIELVQKYKLYDSVMISSFNIKTVKNIETIDRRIIRGLLYDPLYHPLHSPAAYAKSLGVQYLIISRKMLLKRIVSAVHNRDMMMGEFVVNTNRQTDRSLRYGVDAIYTNSPSEVITFLNRRK